MLKFGAIELFDNLGESPLVPQLSPRSRRGSLLQGLSLTPESTTFTGISGSYVTRWASGQNSGLLPIAKVKDLIALYESGANFAITTDFFRPVGDVAIYAGCYFAPGETPVFAASEVLDFYLMDFTTRIPVATL